MSLEGSLETVGLPDVLWLLGRSAKSGRLGIAGGKRAGGVWLADGAIAAVSAGRQADRDDPVDALFELLRVEVGDFAFEEGPAPLDGPPPVDLDETLAAAQARLAEWRAIEAVVGSLESTVELVSGTTGSITVSPEQWDMVIATRGASEVGEVLDRRGMGEFDGCKAIKELVDAGLARIAVPEPAPEAASQLPPLRPPGPEEVVPNEPPTASPGGHPERAESSFEEPGVARAFGPNALPTPTLVFSTPVYTPDAELGPDFGFPEGFHTEQAMAQAAADAYPDGFTQDGEPVNRGLLLKFLSTVRP